MIQNELPIYINFRSKKTLSDQVQEEMRRLIQEGFLQPGSQLPTVRTLAAQLRINFNTVARAYRILDEEGWISTQQGRGTYILEPTATGQKDYIFSKEQKVEKFIRHILENAERLEIEANQLLSEIFRRLGRPVIQTPKNLTHHKIQKKPARRPAWLREWNPRKRAMYHTTKRARKERRKRKSFTVSRETINVSRETIVDIK